MSYSATMTRPEDTVEARPVVRALVVHTYHPVGAGERADRAPFGQVLIDLEDGPENDLAQHARRKDNGTTIGHR